MHAPADWYPDPTARHDQRWWDGTVWTEHVFTAGEQSVDPLPPAVVESAVEADGDVGQTGDTATAAEPVNVFAETPVADLSPQGESEEGAAVDVDTDGSDADEGTSAAPDEETSDDGGPEPVEVEDPEPEALEAEAAEAEAAEAEAVDAQVDEPDVYEAEVVDPGQDSGAGPVGLPPSDMDASPHEPSSPFTVPGDVFVMAPATAQDLTARAAGAREPAPAPAQDASSEDASSQHPVPDTAPDEIVPTPPSPVWGDDESPAPMARPSTTRPTWAFAHDGIPGVQVEASATLRCAMDDRSVLARLGTLTATHGDIDVATVTSKRRGRRQESGAVSLVRISGSGETMLADDARHVTVLEVATDVGLTVAASAVVAFDDQLTWESAPGVGEAGSTVTLRGTGWVAVSSRGEAVALTIDGGPADIDVMAAVAWPTELEATPMPASKERGPVVRFVGTGMALVQPSVEDA